MKPQDEVDSFKEDRQLKINENIVGNHRRSKHRHRDPVPSSEWSDDDHSHDNDEYCKFYNLTDSTERKDCTPGSEYIIRCQICVCPYMGSISLFCRPMPKDRYCEQAYPGFNFLPSGRRTENQGNSTENATMTTIMSSDFKLPRTIYMPHNHTKYKCDVNGRIEEECFICDCKKNIIIEEHCFKSNAENCTNVSVPKCIKEENRLHT